MTIRQQLRDQIRALFGLLPGAAPGTKAERDRRRQARLDADTARWAKAEAAAREEQEFDRLTESETLRARLETKLVLW
jgi:hypothetical protein